MEKKRFFIYCASGLGLEFVRVVLRCNGITHEWDEIRFVDDAPELRGKTVNDIEVWSFEDYLNNGPQDSDRFIVASGEATVRAAIDEKLQAHGIKLGCTIHPENYIIPSAEIGPGAMFQTRAYPGPNSKVGRCVILQSTCIIGHNVDIGDYCTVSSFAFIGGDTTIGEHTYIAPGAMIRNGLTIGKNCIIGMGSVVTKDVPDNSVVAGNPARIIRENTSGKVFKK